jgi:hypothetical protein
MLSQEALFMHLARRIGAAQSGLQQICNGMLPAAAIGLTDLDDVLQNAPTMSAVGVLHTFDPATFISEALNFALSLPDGWRDEWFRSFTRTIFLLGNVANLQHRFPFQHLAHDRSSAWLGPASTKQAMGLRRLLVLVPPYPLPKLPDEVLVGVGSEGEFQLRSTPARTRRLYLSTDDLNLNDYLINANHLLAEGVLTGLLKAGDQLVVRHIPSLELCEEEFEWLRVHYEKSSRKKLRAYGGFVRTG